MPKALRITTRKALLIDAPHLFSLRCQSILKLAPKGMTVAQAELWASKATIDGVRKVLEEKELWVAESDGVIIGWVAFHGDYLDGLYTDPRFVERGVGAQLLELAEQAMRGAGVRAVRADASWNAEEFYLRRGYEPLGPRPADGPRPLVKRFPLRRNAN
jgi:putative acetyltransferase